MSGVSGSRQSAGSYNLISPAALSVAVGNPETSRTPDEIVAWLANEASRFARASVDPGTQCHIPGWRERIDLQTKI
eukprot:scaffold342974_cov31-Prasinocladus_malaysianus.AAC.2